MFHFYETYLTIPSFVRVTLPPSSFHRSIPVDSKVKIIRLITKWFEPRSNIPWSFLIKLLSYCLLKFLHYYYIDYHFVFLFLHYCGKGLTSTYSSICCSSLSCHYNYWMVVGRDCDKKLFLFPPPLLLSLLPLTHPLGGNLFLSPIILICFRNSKWRQIIPRRTYWVCGC